LAWALLIRPKRHGCRGGDKRWLMKLATVVGIFLIVVGIAVFVLRGISFTEREEVLDLGPLEVTKEETRTFPLPQALGGIALAGGIVLVIVGARRK
jgi:hypothetical protein